MGVVHRKVKRRERELTSIKNAGGRFLGVIHLLDDVARNFLRWIAIIGGESVEHFLAPDPVLEHLRWRFYEIAGDMRSGETSGLGAGCNLMQRVTEFVEKRFHVGVRHKRRLVRARRRKLHKSAVT